MARSRSRLEKRPAFFSILVWRISACPEYSLSRMLVLLLIRDCDLFLRSEVEMTKSSKPDVRDKSHTAQRAVSQMAPASSSNLLIVSVLISLMCVSCGCTHPNRPTNVASDAKWVPSAKTGYWQACSAGGSEKDQLNCTVWNEKGTVLMNEAYLPLDGGAVPASGQLSIADGPCVGPYEVCLENGRVLAPVSIFEREKELLQRNP